MSIRLFVFIAGPKIGEYGGGNSVGDPGENEKKKNSTVVVTKGDRIM